MGINIKARNEGKRSTQRKVLIVCEGAKTEPTYFQSFRVAKQVCDVRGIGANTVSLVRHAHTLSLQDEYREVWCVFDRDSFTKQNVTSALALAERFGFKCAFSNESFELWYVLHFCYLDTQISRHDYCVRLGHFLKFPYVKNDHRMYGFLKSMQPIAIKNAKKLEKVMCKPGVALVDARPSTSVYRLVERLNALEKKLGR